MTDYPDRTNPATTLYCVAPGCRHKPIANQLEAEGETPPTPRFAVTGTELCEWHHARFPRILADLVTLWEQLEEATVRRPQAQTNDRVKTSGLADVASFWNPAASTVLYDLGDWAGFLARTVIREHPLPAPHTQEYPRHRVWYDEEGERQVERWTETRVIEYSHGMGEEDHPRLIIATVAMHFARWFTAYPSIGASVLQEALDLRTAALRAIDTAPVRRLGLKGHTCQHVVEEDPVWGPLLCSAPLAAILRPGDGNRPSEILCTKNPRDHAQLPRDRWMEYTNAR